MRRTGIVPDLGRVPGWRARGNPAQNRKRAYQGIGAPSHATKLPLAPSAGRASRTASR